MSNNDLPNKMSGLMIGGIITAIIFVLFMVFFIVYYFTVYRKIDAIIPSTYTPPIYTPPIPSNSETGAGITPAPIVTPIVTPTAPVNQRLQAFNAAKAAIQPYTCPSQSFGYGVQAIKRNNPDYTLDSFNNPAFDSLANSNDNIVGAKFAGFRPGMYLIGGSTNFSGTPVSGEYMYCRVVGNGLSTDPRRIACGTPAEPLKFDTKGFDLGHNGTSFFGFMCGSTTINGKTSLVRSVGNGELAAIGLTSTNGASLTNQYESIRMIRPKTDGLP